MAYIELDDLFWLDNWQELSDELFFAKIQQQIEQSPEGYVIDGNYSRSQFIKWQDIDTIIWLDLLFHVNFYRSVKRAFQRAIHKKKLWENSNNTESLKKYWVRIQLSGG